MPITVTCSCGKSYQAPDNVAGRRVKCPACGGAIAVPDGPASDPLGVAAASASPFASAGATSGYATTAAYAQPAYGQPAYGQPAQPASGGYAQPQGFGDYSGYAAQPAYAQPQYGQPQYGYSPQYGQQSSGGMGKGLKIGLAVGGVVLALAVVGFVGLALLLPAVQAARNAARRAAERNDAAQAEIAAGQSSSSPGGGSSSGPTGGSSLAWRTYNAAGDGYSIEFPAAPVEKSQSQNTAYGNVELKIVQAAMPDGAVFQATSTRLPAFPDGESTTGELGRTMLEGGVKGMVERLPGGRLLSSSTVDKGRYPGREALLTMTAGGTQGEGHFRIYLSATHIYQIGWLGPQGKKPQADVDRFLNSFNITSPPPDAAPAGRADPGMPPLAQPGGIPGGFPGGPPGVGNIPGQGVAGGATPPGIMPGGTPPGIPGGGNTAIPGGANDPFGPVTPGAGGAANPPGFPNLPGGRPNFPNIPGAPGMPGGPNFPTRPNFPNFPGGPGGAGGAGGPGGIPNMGPGGANPAGPGGRNFGPRNIPRPNLRGPNGFE